VFEAALTGKEHGDAMLFTCGNDVLVFDAPAWLDYYAYSGLSGLFDIVDIGEEGVTS
jgi:hypothetical protein